MPAMVARARSRRTASARAVSSAGARRKVKSVAARKTASPLRYSLSGMRIGGISCAHRYSFRRPMNTRHFLLALAALTASVLHAQSPGDPFGGNLFPPDFIMGNADAINFTEEQRQALRET